MRSGIRPRSAFLPAVALFGLATGPLAGQTPTPGLERTHFGIGYVANAPGLLAGGNAYLVIPRWGGVGIYVDAKFDIDNPSGDDAFVDSLDATQVANQVTGAEFVDAESSWRSINVALVRPVSAFLMVYGGAGISHRTRYHFYEEPSQTLGLGGVFWVEAPAEEEDRVNLMLGVLMRLSSRVSTQFGFETEPRGLSVGASLRLPRW
jgi:hypothetical protein